MTFLQESTECCDNALRNIPTPVEDQIVGCDKCWRYWRFKTDWYQLGIFELVRLRKMGRIK